MSGLFTAGSSRPDTKAELNTEIVKNISRDTQEYGLNLAIDHVLQIEI